MIKSRLHAATMVVLGMMAAAAQAQSPQQIYVSTGEHGEISFSDVARPGAERVEVATAEPVDDPAAELDRRIEQTLSVANALEESRLAREQARAEARAQAAAAEARAEPQVIYQERYVGSPYVFDHRFDHRFDRRFDGRFKGHHRDFRDKRFDKRHHDGHRGDRRGRDRGRRTISKPFPYDPD